MTFTPCRRWVKPCVPTATHGMDHYAAAPVLRHARLRAAPGRGARPGRGRSVTGGPPVGEAGDAPGGGLGRRLVAGDPAGDHLRGDRGHEDAGPEVPRGQPRVAEARHPGDDRAPVPLTRPED